MERVSEEHAVHGEAPAPTISKLWLIGRSHSAALERRRKADEFDKPYQDAADALLDGKVDRLIDAVGRGNTNPPYCVERLTAAVDAAVHLGRVFHKVTGLWKPSLASKYLHFHAPVSPILDSIAGSGLRMLVSKADLDADLLDLWNRDLGYARHVARFSQAQRRLVANDFENPTARRIDTFLLWWNSP